MLNNGTIEAVVNMHVLHPNEVFSALELTRPLVQGRIDAILGILEQEIYNKLHDFWTILQRFTILRERYDHVVNETIRYQKQQQRNSYILTWISRDILWGTMMNVCIYMCIILGAYVRLM